MCVCVCVCVCVRVCVRIFISGWEMTALKGQYCLNDSSLNHQLELDDVRIEDRLLESELFNGKKTSIWVNGNLEIYNKGKQTRTTQDDKQLNQEPVSSLLEVLCCPLRTPTKNKNWMNNKVSQDACSSCSDLWPTTRPRAHTVLTAALSSKK